MFKQYELKLLWPFYLQNFLLSLSKVIMPFYVLYFLGIGLSFFQIAMIGSIRSIITIVFEIPTGTVADLFGRKASVVLGYLFSSLTLFLMFFAHSFYVIVIILALDAVFETLISGADRAWAVDLLEEQDKELLDRYFIRMRLFRNLGLVISPILASLIVAKANMSYLWLVFALGTFTSTVFLFFGREAKRDTNTIETEKEEKSKYFLGHLKESVLALIRNKILIVLFAVIFIFYFVDEITGLAWTPHLENVGVKLPTIGYLFSVIAAIGVFLPFLTEWLLKYKSKLYILFFTILVYALLLISVGFISTALLVMLVFVIFSSAEEIFLPLEDALTNFFIESKNRATILSIKSVVESFASIIGGPIAGYILGILSLRQAFTFSGILLLIIPCLYLLIKEQGRAKARPWVGAQ